MRGNVPRKRSLNTFFSSKLNGGAEAELRQQRDSSKLQIHLLGFPLPLLLKCIYTAQPAASRGVSHVMAEALSTDHIRGAEANNRATQYSSERKEVSHVCHVCTSQVGEPD